MAAVIYHGFTRISAAMQKLFGCTRLLRLLGILQVQATHLRESVPAESRSILRRPAALVTKLAVPDFAIRLPSAAPKFNSDHQSSSTNIRNGIPFSHLHKPLPKKVELGQKRCVDFPLSALPNRTTILETLSEISHFLDSRQPGLRICYVSVKT